MRHPFDGITPPASPTPTRRSALATMIGAAFGVLGVQAAAKAQIKVTTLAIGEEGATRARGEGGVADTMAFNEQGGRIRPGLQPQSVERTEKEMEAAAPTRPEASERWNCFIPPRAWCRSSRATSRPSR